MHDIYNPDTAIDQALWDLAAKRAGLPLFRFLGGTDDRPRAYGSGLEFHMAEADIRILYAAARADGYSAYKVKLGMRWSTAENICRVRAGSPSWRLPRLATAQ